MLKFLSLNHNLWNSKDLHAVIPNLERENQTMKCFEDALPHERLDREDVVESIDDQARQAVPLGVDDAVSIGHLLQPEHLVTQGDGPIDPAFPEFLSRRVDTPGEEAQGDLRAAIPQAEADRQSGCGASSRLDRSSWNPPE